MNIKGGCGHNQAALILKYQTQKLMKISRLHQIKSNQMVNFRLGRAYIFRQ